MINWPELVLPPLNLYNFPKQREKFNGITRYTASRLGDSRYPGGPSRIRSFNGIYYQVASAR